MAIHKSGEDYLEAILMVRQEKGYCRSIDVAHHLNVSKPSVSVAMKNLRELGHITVSKEGFINLTASGREIADMIYERHQLLSAWLVSPLGYEEGKTYYYDETGAMHMGWLTDPPGSEGQTFYFSERGTMVTGWANIGDYWYYFHSGG